MQKPPAFAATTVWPGKHVGKRQVAAKIPDAGPGKTPGPRFDTLVVRGAGEGSRRTSAYSETLYDGMRESGAARKCLIRGSGESWALNPHSRNASVSRNFAISRNV